jgi:cellulose synthase/poly-beta-1,6-N-acetylglucosamine synthase-like glycosyltransferase
MSLLVAGVVLLLWSLIAYQATLSWRFWRELRRFRVELVADSEAPPAAVILCLRGTDPFLERCLRGLLDQDYPDYGVRIIVDGPHDPAHQTLREVLGRTSTNRVRIENLGERYPTCSLKCSALYQAISNLEPRFEIVAQIDADTVPHRTWLRELVTALKPADVGAATGNRWYMPSVQSFGALVRYVWNAGAVTQMLHHRIAWGGTMATKASVFRDSDLLIRWRQAFCEDAIMRSALEELGLRQVFVPGLIMVNRENISVSGFFRWIKRQMLNVRLYHASWRPILMHCALSTIAPLAAALLLLLGNSGSDTGQSALLWSLNCFGISYFLCLLPLIGAVREIVGERGEPTVWISLHGVLKMFLAFPLTPIVYAAATLAAAFARQSEWRGIRYKIDGPWEVRMEEYRPYKSQSDTFQEDLDQYQSVA